jgi:hypothetical protein
MVFRRDFSGDPAIRATPLRYLTGTVIRQTQIAKKIIMNSEST